MVNAGKIVFLFTFFALIAQSLIFFYDEADELIAVPVILVLGGIGAFFLSKNRRDPDAEFQTNIFLWAFSLRIWMGLILYGWGLSSMFGDEDASGYPIGWSFVENWYRNGLEGFVNNLSQVFFERQNIGQGLIWAVPTMIASGPSRMIVSAVNSFAGAMLVIVVFRMARRVFDSHTARIAAILVTFWASNILLSASTSKEMLVIAFEWAILFLLIRDPRGLSAKDGLAAMPAFLAVFAMRFYALYLLAAAAVFRFLIADRAHLLRNLAFGTAIVASLFIFLNAGGAITRDFARLERLNQQIEGWREGMAQSTGSGVEVYSQYESTTVAIPVATVYFFFAPFPWEAFSGSARNAFGAVENLFILAMLIVGFPAIKIFFKDKFVEMAPIFVFCLLYAGMHIWGLSNVGLAWRHKQTVMPLVFMLVAVAITQRRAMIQLIRGRQRESDRPLSVVRA